VIHREVAHGVAPAAVGAGEVVALEHPMACPGRRPAMRDVCVDLRPQGPSSPLGQPRQRRTISIRVSLCLTARAWSRSR
jgi:hypothetical protein